MGNIFSAVLGSNAAYNQAEQQRQFTKAQRTISDADTDARNLISKTNTDAANAMRTAQNAIKANAAQAANQTRSAQNNVRLANAGKAADAITTNILRTADSVSRGSFEQRIRSAEQLGALVASASAAGVGGGSVEALKSVTNIQEARGRQQSAAAVGQATYDMLTRRAGIHADMFTDLDLSSSMANVDYQQNVFTEQPYAIIGGEYAPDPATVALDYAMRNIDWGSAGNVIGAFKSSSSPTPATAAPPTFTQPNITVSANYQGMSEMASYSASTFGLSKQGSSYTNSWGSGSGLFGH